MTREEEIKEVSKQRHLEKYNCEGFCPDFEAGIRWADEHPSQKALAKELHKLGYAITLNGDVISKENEDKAIENYVHYQKQKLIEQACDWLFEHSDDSIVMGDNGVYEFDRELLIESFKTAISKI